MKASAERQQLLYAARELLSALEDPEEETWRFVLQPAAQACATVAWNCGILDEWPKATMTCAELAERSGMSQALVIRVMRALGIYGIFREMEEEVYEHTVLSKAMSTNPLKGSTRFM